MTELLRVNNFYIELGHLKLSIDDLSIARGEFITIMGENGCGKTTFLDCLFGSKQPRRGAMKMVGQVNSPTNRGSINSQTGWVLSGKEDYPVKTTIRRFLDEISTFYETWDKSLESRLLSDFELVEDKKLTELSLGEQSKLKLLKALCFHPKLLILDELTANLSPKSQETIIETIIELFSENNMGVLCISHFKDEAWKMSDRIYEISNQKLKIMGANHA